VKEPVKTNPVRLGVLFAILALVLMLLVHHYKMAAPATDKAYADIEEMFKQRNAKGVTEGGKIDAKLVTPTDVQELLKKKPWYTDKQKDYTVECYWWYGMPHKNYITVLYYGNDDKLRFNTHYMNAKPPAEHLPNAEIPGGPPEVSNTAPPTSGEGTVPKTETPATDDGTAKPAEEKPGETKPAEKTEGDKPAEEKPAEAKPAEEKPADK